jgi:prephenate dehydrogenase
VFRAIEHDNPFAAEVRRRFFDLAEQARSELDD